MAISVTSLTRNGMRDWIIQRVTAIILALYVIYFFAYFITHPHVDYSQWHSLFQCTWMRYFSFFALVSIVLHSWIGIWTVLTDYVKCYHFRLLLNVVVWLALVSYLVFGIEILWGF
ncbi:MAG: succinate dehydrogenase, hydrophobic membrane anchor protein [Legionellales bacterium]|nr:succinate dehydrogenase, hydrophobic membrane anchor protein [Legionellales bacterium]